MAETNHEEFVWSGSVSQWHYVGKWLTVVVLLVLVVCAFLFYLEDIALYVWPIRGVLAGVPMVIMFWIHLDRSRRKYSVTNKRVTVEYGLISRNSNEVRFQDIRSINLTESGISGLLGIGRIEFSSAATDEAEVIFWNCPDAVNVRDKVRALHV